MVIIPGRYFNPSPSGAVDTLIINGGNGDLKPEKATAWTAGLDFKPDYVPGMSVKLTYYDIVFKDQIGVAAGVICECNAFNESAELGSTIFQRNTSAALVQSLVSAPTYVNYFDGDPATGGAIFDNRYLNLSTVKTRGLDFRLGYKRGIGGAQWDTGIDGTYILKFEDQFTNSAPVSSILNSQFNPTDIRLRGRAVVSIAGMNMGAYLNFVNAYTNNAVIPAEHVASLTTADAVASYTFRLENSVLDGAVVSLSVINIADRDPPYMAVSTSFGVNFDGANANAQGRFISLHVHKRW